MDYKAKRLFREIWSEGMPENERLVFEAVPPEQRAGILRRIEAAWRGENGEPWEALAKKVGLKRAGFYKLRSGWRKSGIAGVIRNETQRPRKVAAADDDPLRDRASDLLRSEGGRARNVDIARRLVGEPSEDPVKARVDLQRAERLVQHQRRALALDPDFLSKTFGSGVLVDLTAISILLEGPDPAPAVVAVVAETASGLIMGSAIGAREDAVRLARAAVGSALKFLAAHRADRSRVDGSPCDLGFTLPPSASEYEIDFSRLTKVVGILELGRPGGFSYGQALVQLVGPRIGRTVLAPRSTLAIDGAAYAASRIAPVMGLRRARATWEREVLRHNDPVENVLGAAGLLDVDGEAAGAMAEVLVALDRELKMIASGRQQPAS